jgi:hypothetical protein
MKLKGLFEGFGVEFKKRKEKKKKKRNSSSVKPETILAQMQLIMEGV